MKVLDIALKDMLRSTRSMFALMFMFVMPVMITAIIYFAFGNVTADEGVELAITRVVVANLDEADAGYGNFSAGETLSTFLLSEELAEVLQVETVADEAAARQAVTDRDADVAVIIPSGFTAAILEPERKSHVTLYQDPTLTLGPAIVKGIISQFVDGFAGSKIATGVIFDQLNAHDVEADGRTLQKVIMQYATWSADAGAGQPDGDSALLDIQVPQTGRQTTDDRTAITTVLMAGMMIFYVFFTGAATAQTIIREEEEGTLQRLFTTPTSASTILAGKVVASFMTLSAQVAILMLASNLLFHTQWGAPLPTLLVAIGTIAVAAGFGLFLMSLLKSSKQVGIVYGGVMTVTGMLGGLFSATIPGVPAVFDTVTLSMPQGWALRGWKLTLAGGGIQDVWLPVVVMIVVAGLFLAIGTARFRKRFA